MAASSHGAPLLHCWSWGWGSRRQEKKMPPHPIPCLSLPVTGKKGTGRPLPSASFRLAVLHRHAPSVYSGAFWCKPFTQKAQDDISKNSQASRGRLYSASGPQLVQPACSALWIQLFTAQLFNEHLPCVIIWGGEDTNDKQKPQLS